MLLEPPSPKAHAWSVQDLTAWYRGAIDTLVSIKLETLCNTYHLTEFTWLLFQHFGSHANNLISLSIFSIQCVISILLERWALLQQAFQMEMRNDRIEGIYTKQPEVGFRDVFLKQFSILVLKQGLSWSLELIE